VADRSIVVRLRAEVADFKSAMKDASKSIADTTDGFSKGVQKNSEHINTLANQAGLLGAAMVGASVLAIKSFADFDAEMSNVQAATHETAGTMDLLRAAAIKAGKDTIFNAKESASAITEMAKAGVNAKDILGGGLTGALALASAGSIDVADAAEIAASTLNQFNLKGSDMTHVADLLAAGANKAQGGVLDLGNGLKFVGPVAAGMNVSLEETVGVLSQFASKGVIGEQAGTSLRGVLASLTSPSKEAATELENLGVNLYDATGKFLGLSNMAGQMKSAYAGMTDAQKNASLGVIFGNQQVTAARLLLDGGKESVDKWTKAVDDQGYASETAAIKLNNLKGDWEQLTGSIETASISLGESANGPLRAVVQSATDIVNALAEAPGVVQGLLLAIVGGGGLVLLGGAGLAKLVTSIAATKDAMVALKISGQLAATAVGGIGIALGIASVALGYWSNNQAEAAQRTSELADSLDQTTGKITDNTRAVVINQLATGTGWWVFKVQSAYDAAGKLGIAMDVVTDAALGNADAQAKVSAAIEANNAATKNGNYDEYAASIGRADVSSSDAATAIINLRDRLKEQGVALDEATTQTEQKIEADKKSAGSQKDAADATGVATAAINDQVDALQELVDGQNKAAGAVLSERDAQRNLQASIDDAIKARKDNGETLDIDTEKGRANQAALDDVAKSTWDVIDAMKANGSGADQLRAQMTTARQSFLDVADAMGIGTEDAKALADQLGLIPENIVPTVHVDLTDAYQAMRAFRDEVSKGIQIRVDTNANYSPATSPNSIRRAAGGPVWGAGTATSDSIPALLSHGEYVVKASSVSKYGHGFMDSINAGRFASGGLVGGSVGATISGGTTVQQYITTSDPIGAADAAARRFVMAGV